MLPSAYRFQVHNDGLGTDVDAEVKKRGIGVDASTLAQTYGSWSADLGTANIANDTFSNTASQDNATDQDLAVEVEVTLSNFGAAPNDAGTVKVYLQGAGDAGTDWPDDGNGTLIMAFDPDATGTYRKTVVV